MSFAHSRAIAMADNLLIPWLTLVHTKGLGPGSLRKLQENLQHVGSASVEAILASSDSKLRQAGLSEKVVSEMRNVDQSRIERDLQWVNEADDRAIITRDSDHYPKLLLQIADPPLVLYVRGDPDVLNTPQLAIVGTRKPSHSAERHAFDMASQLAGYGITVTSGLALGVDSFAHRGALAAGGYTIAVTSTGLDRVYPAVHQQLAQEIAENSAIVSEFPIGTNPIASYFPRRNRIISGLCYGTLVVEATLKSGTLTTAAHATSQAREVFAIPGNIDNPQSRGCHALLKSGATLVESVADILVQLAPLLPQTLDDATTTTSTIEQPVHRPAKQQVPRRIPEPRKPRSNKKPDHSPGPADENTASQQENSQATEAEPADNGQADSIPADDLCNTLLETLGYDPMSLDQLVERSGFDVVTVTKMTIDLELSGAIQKIPGGNFVRTGT